MSTQFWHLIISAVDVCNLSCLPKCITSLSHEVDSNAYLWPSLFPRLLPDSRNRSLCQHHFLHTLCLLYHSLLRPNCDPQLTSINGWSKYIHALKDSSFQLQIRKHHTLDICSLQTTSYLKFEYAYRNPRYIYKYLKSSFLQTEFSLLFSPLEINVACLNSP